MAFYRNGQELVNVYENGQAIMQAYQNGESVFGSQDGELSDYTLDNAMVTFEVSVLGLVTLVLGDEDATLVSAEYEDGKDAFPSVATNTTRTNDLIITVPETGYANSGDDVEFTVTTTQPGAAVSPEATTLPGLSTATTTTFRGTIGGTGGGVVMGERFYYKQGSSDFGTFNSTVGTWSSATQIGAGEENGQYSALRTNLPNDTTYYYAFVIGNEIGFDSGNILSVTTDSAPMVTYAPAWVNDGGAYRGRTIVSQTTCVTTVDSSTCASDQLTCPVGGTNDQTVDYSNYMQDQILICRSSEGTEVSGGFCTFAPGQGVGDRRTQTYPYGAQTGVVETGQSCTTNVPNDGYEDPEVFTPSWVLDPSTLSGGQQTITSQGACMAPSSLDTSVGCDPSMLLCSVAGNRTITYDVSAVTGTEYPSCVSNLQGSVAPSFCGFTDAQVNNGRPTTVSPAQTGLTTSVSCDYTYNNPDHGTGLSCLTTTVFPTGFSVTISYTDCSSNARVVTVFSGGMQISYLEGTLSSLSGGYTTSG